VALAQFDGTDVARRQRLILTKAATTPDRADGMDHMQRREAISNCDLGVAGLAAPELATFGQ